MRCPDVLVIGAGVIGAASAYFLSKRGYKVLLIDKEGIASGASGAAEGIVGSVTKRKLGLVTSIVVESFKMFPELCEELDYDIEFTPKPGLMVIDDESQLNILERFVDKKKETGLEIKVLGQDTTREMEPLLSDNILGAVYTPAQGIVNPLRLSFGYVEAARRLGAEFAVETLTRFEFDGNRVTTVQTSESRIAPNIVVNAAGNEAGEIAKLAGLNIEVLPKRVHMIVSETLPEKTLRNTIYCARNVVGGLNPKTLYFEDAPEKSTMRASEIEDPW